MKCEIIRFILAVANVREQYGFQIGIMLVSSGSLSNCTRVTPYIYSSDLALPDKKSDFPTFYEHESGSYRASYLIWFIYNCNINCVVWFIFRTLFQSPVETQIITSCILTDMRRNKNDWMCAWLYVGCLLWQKWQSNSYYGISTYRMCNNTNLNLYPIPNPTPSHYLGWLDTFWFNDNSILKFDWGSCFLIN